MKSFVVFFVILLAFCSGLFYGLPGEQAKKTLVIFICEFPLWGLYTLKRLAPLNNAQLASGLWRSKFFFALFLGYGLGILFFVVGMVILSFVSAISGMDLGVLFFYCFPLLKAAPMIAAISYLEIEIGRLFSWGLDYREKMVFDGPSPEEDITTQGMGETLIMLTILDLEPDLTMESLKERYRELVKLYHPDRLAAMGDGERETAEQEFKRIKRAYELVKSQLEKGNL